MSADPTDRAVLDLPHMVEHVPRGPAHEIARRPRTLDPTWFRDRAPESGRAQRREDRVARLFRLDRTIAGGLWRPRPELGHVHLLGAGDVLDDLVEVANAAAGTLPQLEPAGALRRAIEGAPTRDEDLPQALDLGFRHRCAVRRNTD